MNARRYSIGELAELTGVSRRTVHFYVQRRLIDPPLGRGRGRHYDDGHVQQIREVRALQRLGVPLAAMSEGARAAGLVAGAASGSDPLQVADSQQVAESQQTALPKAPAASPGQPRAAAQRQAPAASPGRPPALPSVTPVVRVRVADGVTLELAEGGVPVTPGLLAELAAAVDAVLGRHRQQEEEEEEP